MWVAGCGNMHYAMVMQDGHPRVLRTFCSLTEEYLSGLGVVSGRSSGHDQAFANLFKIPYCSPNQRRRDIQLWAKPTKD